MFLLAFKITVAIAFVTGIPELAKRCNEQIAGILSAMPLLSGLALFFSALDSSNSAAVAQSISTAAGMVAAALFYVGVFLALKMGCSLLSGYGIGFLFWIVSAAVLRYWTEHF